MTSPDPLRSPRLRINAAQEDILSITEDITTWIKSEPYTSVIERDADGIHLLHKAKLTKPLPDRLSHKCIRVAEDLRSALDQTGYAMALLAGVANPRFAYFPIAENEVDFQHTLAGKCKELPSDIKTLFASYKAYKGGNDALYSLNVLVRASKHRFIEPAISRSMERTVEYLAGSGPTEMFPKSNRDDDDIVLLRVAPDTRIAQANLKVTYFVAFGKIDIVAGIGVEVVLRGLTKIVTDIVGATETEAKRIGLIS